MFNSKTYMYIHVFGFGIESFDIVFKDMLLSLMTLMNHFVVAYSVMFDVHFLMLFTQLLSYWQ